MTTFREILNLPLKLSPFLEVVMTEQEIQNKIILEVNKLGHRLWRANAGKVQTKDNRIIKLFPRGFSDTVGFRKQDGKAIFIEVKTRTGKLRPEQKKFRDFLINQPVIYGVARSPEEAINIIENGEIYYD